MFGNGDSTGVDPNNVVTITTTGTGIGNIVKPIQVNDAVVSQYPVQDSICIRTDYITQEEHEREIKKRDDKIKDLEDKLESLTKQVASILEGNKDVIDDNVTTEQLKRMFD